jgi:hypothetical protein
MDAPRFDRATRALSSGTARRTLLVGVVSSLLASLPVPLRPEAALAKHKHKHKHHKSKPTCKGQTKLCRHTCIPEDDCCDTTDCPEAQVCTEGTCLCPRASDIFCGDTCCDGAADQVCVSGDKVCQAGGCPTTDVCNDPDTFFCADTANGVDRPCVCASIIDATETTACVDFFTVLEPASCTVCNLGAPCGAGKVCIPGNTAGGQFCGCDNTFCVPRCANAPGDRHI